MNRIPYPYIQNKTSWCWAVCAEVVGHFLCIDHPEYGFDLESWRRDHPFGIEVEDSQDVRKQYAGSIGQKVTVDAVQWAIVKNANDGNEGVAWDQGKENAIKYAATGDIHTKWISVETVGSYYGMLESGYNMLLDFWCAEKGQHCAIGNFYVANLNKAHSVVLRGDDKKIRLYDPWTGYNYHCTPEEIFSQGIDCEWGQMVVSWIQTAK
jgi:hypothetical protein